LHREDRKESGFQNMYTSKTTTRGSWRWKT